MRAQPANMFGLVAAWRAALVCLVLLAFSPATPARALSAGDDASSFQGQWQGPWQERALGQSGAFLLIIDGKGAVNGVVTNGTKHGIVRGAIGADGKLAAVYSYDGTTFFAAQGSFVRQGSHLRGIAHYFTSSKKDLGSSALDLRLVKPKPDASDSEAIGAPLSPTAPAAIGA